MFQNLGLQLFTIRDYMKDAEFANLSFRRLHELGYTEAHTFNSNLDDQTLVDLLTKNGIHIIGTHYKLDKILHNPEETVRAHRLMGTTNIGIGALPNEARISLDGLKSFIKSYNAAAEQYAKEGFKLTYHNHSFEFERIDGYKTILEIMAEEFDPQNISFVLDTAWVAAGGGDVCGWMEKLAGRVDILHLKDYTVKIPRSSKTPEIQLAEIGNGNLCWDAILATAEKIGVKHYIVEQDGDFDDTPFNSLRMSAEFLKKYQK
ncbi:MAG: sugar phosphate isomerase/epimerase [Clostridia bacterium]|nr:sugar phosphate isomerase/epimerase [Clostridia bacterium]